MVSPRTIMCLRCCRCFTSAASTSRLRRRCRLGATVTLHARFAPDATLAAIATERPTLTVLVPATIQALIEHPLWAETDVSSLRAVTTGSTQVPRAPVDALNARGLRVLQVYGSTETAPIAVYTRIGATSRAPAPPVFRAVLRGAHRRRERIRGAARHCRRGGDARAERVLRVLGQPGGNQRGAARRLVFLPATSAHAMRTAISSFTTARRT